MFSKRPRLTNIIDVLCMYVFSTFYIFAPNLDLEISRVLVAYNSIFLFFSVALDRENNKRKGLLICIILYVLVSTSLWDAVRYDPNNKDGTHFVLFLLFICMAYLVSWFGDVPHELITITTTFVRVLIIVTPHMITSLDLSLLKSAAIKDAIVVSLLIDTMMSKLVSYRNAQTPKSKLE